MTDSSLVNRYRSLAARVYHADKPIGRSFGDVELYTELLRGTDGPILEPAAGNGRVLVPLLEAGLEMVGTDPSPDMLDRCRAECESRGLAAELSLGRFDTVDVRSEYAAVIIPAGSLQLVLDPGSTRAIVEGFFRALRPGGRLILDLDSLHALAETEPWAKSWHDGDDLLTLTALSESVDVVAQTTVAQLRYERWHGGALAETELEQFALRLWGVHEMRLLLEAAGFAEVRVHAGYVRDAAPSAETRVVTLEALKAR
ncbi:class I SAM-dependent methyltransferase [Leucobacter sp. BZR 635]